MTWDNEYLAKDCAYSSRGTDADEAHYCRTHREHSTALGSERCLALR